MNHRREPNDDMPDFSLSRYSGGGPGWGSADQATPNAQPSRPIELEPGEFTGMLPRQDRRPLLAEPPPVSLELVADAHVGAINGFEHALEDFYVGLIEFE